MGDAAETFELVTLGDGKARETLLSELETQLQRSGWTASEIFGMQMAIEESVSNAYRHGNQNGSLGSVTIRWQVSAEEFSAQIRDEGQGFDESGVPDAMAPENLEQLSGRGLLLMRGYMDEVEYKDGGCMVEMRKTRQTATTE